MNSKKRALITGISGQDGFFLTTELARLGYEVVGLTRSLKTAQSAIPELLPVVRLIETDYSFESLKKIVAEFLPQEVYHFAAQPYVGKSWNLIDETVMGTAMLTAHLLEAVRTQPGIRFFNASSSEIYADSSEPLSEEARKEPSNPYGCAKLFSFQMVQAYRENYGLFAVNGVLFNHESSRRYSDFFSKKLVAGVVDIASKKSSHLKLGNLDITRDWGSAEEYMQAIPALMQLAEPADVNICSAKGTRVLDLVDTTFARAGLDYRQFVSIDDTLVRNKEKKFIVGQNQKIHQLTGWKPQKTIESVLHDMLISEAQKRGLNEISQ